MSAITFRAVKARVRSLKRLSRCLWGGACGAPAVARMRESVRGGGSGPCQCHPLRGHHGDYGAQEKEGAMSIEHVLAVMPVAHFEAAHAWNERLFDRPADNLPMAGRLVEWRVTENGWVQVTFDAHRAGAGPVELRRGRPGPADHRYLREGPRPEVMRCQGRSPGPVPGWLADVASDQALAGRDPMTS